VGVRVPLVPSKMTPMPLYQERVRRVDSLRKSTDKIQNQERCNIEAVKCELTMNRDGVMEDELDDRLSELSAVDDTQLTTSGMLPRRSVFTSGFSLPHSGTSYNTTSHISLASQAHQQAVMHSES